MSDAPTFVHITDLHIGDRETDPTLMTDTPATLRAILAEIRMLDPPPRFLVASGDLTNIGDEASYRTLKAIFAEAALDFPVIFALGNHDRRGPFRSILLEEAGPADGPYDHSLILAGIHVIVLDTSEPMRIGGHLEPRQFDWLRGELDSHAGAPKLIVMHHAPGLDPDRPELEWEGLAYRDTAELARMLSGRGDIAGILSGHVHYDRVALWHGIPVVTTQGQHVATDVVQLGAGLRMVAGASFAVCTLRSSGIAVTFAPLASDRRELGMLGASALADLVARYERLVQEARKPVHRG